MIGRAIMRVVGMFMTTTDHSMPDAHSSSQHDAADRAAAAVIAR
jgi:hypothetical protein